MKQSNILIKLKTKQENFHAIESNRIKEKFIESCTMLDASIFESYIDEDGYFQDLDKYRFLAELKNTFDNTKSRIVKTTELKMSTCLICNRGCKAYAFYKHGKKRFTYMIEFKDEVLTDIYKCNISN